MSEQSEPRAGLSRILAGFEQATPQRQLPFIWQLLLMVLLIAGVALGAMSVNAELLRARLSEHRFSELQVFSDRINDSMFRLETRAQLMAQYGIASHLLKQPTLDIDPLRTFLQQLLTTEPSFRKIAILDIEGQAILSQGEDDHFHLTRRRLEQIIKGLDPGEVYSSPLQLEGEKAHRYVVAPVFGSPHGARAMLFTVEMAESWKKFKTVDGDDGTPLVLVDARGNCFGISRAGKVGQSPLPDRLPELWRNMQQNDFGQFQKENYHYIFMQVRPGSQSPLYLVTYLDNNAQHPLVQRYQRQITIAALVLILVLARLMWHRRYQEDHSRARARAERLLEQVYHGSQGLLIFNSDGRCLTANPSAAAQLDLSPERLHDRRFRHLFDSDSLGVDMVWQLIRGSGYWEGRLMVRHQPKLVVKTTIRAIPFEDNERLFLLTLEEGRLQQDQERQLRQLEQLTDSASGLALIDGHQRIRVINRAMGRILSQPQERLEGTPWLSLLQLTNPDLEHSLNHQLSNRGFWQGALWFRRGDGGVVRCLANLHQGDSLGQDDNYQVLTLSPLMDQKLDDSVNSVGQRPRQNLARVLQQSHHSSHALLLFSQSHQNALATFNDSDALLFRQHTLLQLLDGALPKDALLGEEGEIGETAVLLPGWNDSEATTLAANLVPLLDEGGLKDDLTIGLAQSQPGQPWHQLLDNARAAVVRATLSGQAYCQAHTRNSA
ncbi:PAS domain-containing protein [Marinobacter hydrocarbonoclasticus]|nr:PAS domain-containing protein [Marinobacter nauticus]